MSIVGNIKAVPLCQFFFSPIQSFDLSLLGKHEFVRLASGDHDTRKLVKVCYLLAMTCLMVVET